MRFYLPEWRNWQTRLTQNQVSSGVRVQIPPWAPCGFSVLESASLMQAIGLNEKRRSLLIFYKNYDIIFIESEGKIMFDDFDIQIQSDEREWEFLEWCNAMEEMYGEED